MLLLRGVCAYLRTLCDCNISDYIKRQALTNFYNLALLRFLVNDEVILEFS